MLFNWLTCQLSNELVSQDQLHRQAKQFLIQQKYILPKPISLGKKVGKARKNALLGIYKNIENKLTDKQVKKIRKIC